jgi:alkanesulfonate monooxygenase SsuD/methylene tetrahydromethanopterin reductase-like flavin-dependent oxidoreductase (luciferase family)
LVGLSVARDNPSLNLNRAKQLEKGAAWVGTPETIAKQIRDYQQMVGGFEIASMQGVAMDLGDPRAQLRIRTSARRGRTL